MTQDRPHQNPLLAIGLGICATSMIACMNFFAKLLGPHMSAMDVTFTRNVIALGMVLVLMIFFTNFRDLKTSRPWGHVLRAFLGTSGLFFGFWTFQIMPMAEATLFLFTQPLFVVLFSYPVLKEKVGLFRISAVLIGFSGIVLIAGPSGDLPLSSVLIGLATGFFNASVALCLRWLGSTEKAERTVFYFLAYGMVLTGLLTFVPALDSKIWTLNFDQTIILLSAGLGVCGIASLMVKTQSYRLAPAAIITPTNYTIILWALAFDYFIWNAVPSTEVMIGAAVILSSNILILLREAKIKRQAEQDA